MRKSTLKNSVINFFMIFFMTLGFVNIKGLVYNDMENFMTVNTLKGEMNISESEAIIYFFLSNMLPFIIIVLTGLFLVSIRARLNINLRSILIPTTLNLLISFIGIFGMASVYNFSYAIFGDAASMIETSLLSLLGYVLMAILCLLISVRTNRTANNITLPKTKLKWWQKLFRN